MVSIDEVFVRIRRSSFRQKFRLVGKELAYLQTWGLVHVMKHAGEIIDKRVGVANPPNDGKQTPWRNHPVFVAQHATATCCRGCLQKIHEIRAGNALSAEERAHVLAVIERWLSEQSSR